MMSSRGVIINGTDSYEKYGLQLLMGVAIGSPGLRESRIIIPGANGSLNLSYALTGYPTFGDRTITFQLFKAVKDDELTALRSRLMSDYHGRVATVRFPFDSDHYFQGVLQFGALEANNRGRIPVTMTAEPFRYELADSLADWEWDPFRFDSGVAREYAGLVVDGVLKVHIDGSDMPVSPVFEVISESGNGMTLEEGGVIVGLPDGKNSVVGMMIDKDGADLTFRGVGKVSIEFRGGWL